MKRLLPLGALACLAVVLMGARPAGEFPMFLRLNGEPAWFATSQAGSDGGVLAIVDAGAGQVTKTICHAAACVCPGAACVCPNNGNLSTGINNPAVGTKLAAEVAYFMILQDTTQLISVAPVAAAVRIDGGLGVDCDHWIMR